MALANVFVIGLQLFSDVGIVPSIIQNKHGDETQFLNTAWTIQVIRGVVLWLGCCLIAYPVSLFYEDARILWLLPILGLSSVFNGFNSTAIASIKRRVDLARNAGFEISVQIISLSVLIIWAYFSPTIYALAGSHAVGALIRTAMSYAIIPGYKNWFAWNKDALRELLSFGRWIFLSTAMTFLASQTDRLMLGKLISIEMLGIYTVAATLADIPRQVIGMLGSNVIFPIVSRSATAPRHELRAKILKKRWLLLMAALVMLTIMVCFGDIVIRFLYDSRYGQAAWMFPVIALSLWHTVLYSSMNPCLMGIGRPIYGAIGSAIKFIVLITGLPVSYQMFGVAGVIVTISYSDLPAYLVTTYGLQREKIGNFSQDVKATGIFLSLLIASLFIRFSLGLGTPLDGLM
jgi:O-antigen/teichoic acid export membrane protein